MTNQFRPGGMEERTVEVRGVSLNLSSYSVGKRFSCRIESASGGVIARAMGPTRQEAEASALESADLTIELRTARSSLQRATRALSTPLHGAKSKKEE